MFKSWRYPSAFVLIIYLFSCVPSGNATGSSGVIKSEGKYPAFVLVREMFNKVESPILELPSLMVEVHGEMILSALVPIENEEEEETYLCPEIRTVHNPKWVQSLNTAFTATKSCLFTTKFGRNEPKLCAEEPIPWLGLSTKKSDGTMKMLCSGRANQKLLVFEYNVCDPVENFLSFAKNMQQNQSGFQTSTLITERYQMYSICYDFKAEETLWTKHQVLQPMLIYDPTIEEDNKKKEIDDEINLKEMSTLTYDHPSFKKNFFTNLKKKYEKDTVNMIPQYLVPSQNMALPLWKKAVQHMINTAPLQPQFHELMNAIDEAIAKISILKYTESRTQLHIFTKVDNKDKSIKKEGKIYYNIWYKLIYNEENSSGALIILHNTPDIPEQQECYNTLRCQFQNWVARKSKIKADLLKYVECCPISQERAKQLFQIDLIINKTIPLQNVYRNFVKEDRDLRFMRELGVKPRQSALQIVPVTKYHEDEISPNAELNSESNKPDSSIVPTWYQFTESAEVYDPINQTWPNADADLAIVPVFY